VKTSWGAILLATLPALAGIAACDTGTITNINTDDQSPGDSTGTDDGTGGGTDDGTNPDETGNPDGDATWVPSGPTVTIDYDVTDEDFLNPERGYYVTMDVVTERDPSWVRSTGHTMALATVRLDDYRDRPLDSALLSALRAGFASVREAGIKVIVRFAYNDDASGLDADRAQMLEHISQVTPILRDNADVIAVLQAGFIGAWGEWHSSASGLDNDADRSAILRALLDAMPPSRAVQIRTPMFKDAIFPGGPLSPEEAWSSEDRARVGHHNDCFLASADDYGTFDSPITTWEDYVELDGRYLPVGGETCHLYAPKTDCQAALGFLQDQHWSYLNEEYNQTVLDSWVAQGCADEISRRLGYRLALSSAIVSEAVAPGGVLEVKLAIDNQGFSAPFNRRPVYLELRRGTQRWRVKLYNRDGRKFLPGRSYVVARLRVPGNLVAASDYELSLWLPDEAPAVHRDPRYAIRLANPGVWDAARGTNVITSSLVIDPSAPGDDIDPDATGLHELPR
jgi:hypothetical protein